MRVKSSFDRPSPFYEQGHGGRAAHLVYVVVVLRGELQRGKGHGPLAVDAQGSAEVTTTLREGACVTREETSEAASMTCSKLSSIKSMSLEERCSARLCCSVRLASP